MYINININIYIYIYIYVCVCVCVYVCVCVWAPTHSIGKVKLAGVPSTGAPSLKPVILLAADTREEEEYDVFYPALP